MLNKRVKLILALNKTNIWTRGISKGMKNKWYLMLKRQLYLRSQRSSTSQSQVWSLLKQLEKLRKIRLSISDFQTNIEIAAVIPIHLNMFLVVLKIIVSSLSLKSNQSTKHNQSEMYLPKLKRLHYLKRHHNKDKSLESLHHHLSLEINQTTLWKTWS